jgi:hypothetical protein
MNYSKLITPFTMKADEYQPTGDYLQAMIELARLAKRNTMKTLAEMTGGRGLRLRNQSWLRARSDAVKQGRPQQLSAIVHSGN